MKSQQHKTCSRTQFLDSGNVWLVRHWETSKLLTRSREERRQAIATAATAITTATATTARTGGKFTSARSSTSHHQFDWKAKRGDVLTFFRNLFIQIFFSGTFSFTSSFFSGTYVEVFHNVLFYITDLVLLTSKLKDSNKTWHFFGIF